MRVCICVPCHRHAEIRFARSLADLTYHVGRSMPEVELSTATWSSSLVPFARTKLVETAAKMHADYILFLDADQTFPRDTLSRLLAHGKEIVGVNVAKRNSKATGTAIGLAGERIDEPRTGLEEVSNLGLGICLIKIAVIAKMNLAAKAKGGSVYPLFMIGQVGPDAWFSEDSYFFNKAREAGLSLYVDHDLSREVGHIGEFEYKL
jgi:hypothetical protein